MNQRVSIRVRVNGVEHALGVRPNMLLVDFLRDELGLTGTHVGCEHGMCGVCTVLVNGKSTRGCLVFAAQADGWEVTTSDSLARSDGELHPIQQAFTAEHGLQCGFCTPGMLMTAVELLEANPQPTDPEIRCAVSGVLCRCTGYHNVVRSIEAAAAGLREREFEYQEPGNDDL